MKETLWVKNIHATVFPELSLDDFYRVLESLLSYTTHGKRSRKSMG